jgi:hypothetical protein
MVCMTVPTVVNLGSLDWSSYFLFRAAPHLSSRGWGDPIPGSILLRKSSSTRNGTWDLWVCSQGLWPLDNRGGRAHTQVKKFHSHDKPLPQISKQFSRCKVVTLMFTVRRLPGSQWPTLVLQRDVCSSDAASYCTAVSFSTDNTGTDKTALCYIPNLYASSERCSTCTLDHISCTQTSLHPQHGAHSAMMVAAHWCSIHLVFWWRNVDILHFAMFPMFQSVLET